MFRVSSAPIIRSTQTVVTTTGTLNAVNYKGSLELHLVGCLKHRFMTHGNVNIKMPELLLVINQI